MTKFPKIPRILPALLTGMVACASPYPGADCNEPGCTAPVTCQLAAEDPEGCFDPDACPTGQGPVAVARILDPPPSSPILLLDTVTFDASGCLGSDLEYRWYFTEAPVASTSGLEPGSRAGIAHTIDSESTASQPTLRVDAYGGYRLCLQACQPGGACTAPDARSECSRDRCLSFQAGFLGHVHVQLRWDRADADLDLQYRVPGSAPGDPDAQDRICHPGNPSPDFCEPGLDLDDPHYEFNDRDGFGPENVNHDNPCDGEYEVRVVFVDDSDRGPTTAEVRVYSNGEQIGRLERIMDQRGCEWLAGRVSWMSGEASFEPAAPSGYSCQP